MKANNSFLPGVFRKLNDEHIIMKHLFIFTLLILTTNCHTDHNMKEKQKDIIENYISSYNNFDTEGMVKDLDENILFENISDGEVTIKMKGIKEFKEQAESAKQIFSGRSRRLNHGILTIKSLQLK